MGCDIHVHVEIKIKSNWHHYSTPSIGRNYHLFARLADVRNFSRQVDPICEPKGIPSDATEVSWLDIEKYGNDGHSHSWLTSTELKEVIKDYSWEGNVEWGYLYGNHIWDWEKGKHGYPKTIEDVRIVFFFDN